MQRRLNLNLTRRARNGAIGGFFIVVASSATAFTKSVGHGVGFTIVLLLTLAVCVALVQLVTRPSVQQPER